MKKLYFSLVIITLMLIGGLVGLNSVNAESETKYDLWVNGEQFTSEKTSINCGSGTAVYDASSNTVTLNNATITKGYLDEENDETTGILYSKNKDLKIVIQGNNAIKQVDYGIEVYGNLVLEGKGLLNVKTNEECISAYNYEKETYGKVSFNSGEFVLISNETDAIDASKIDVSNYKYKIMGGMNSDGINADLISQKDLSNSLLTPRLVYYSYIKMGNFKTYKIKTSANQIGYKYVPKNAYAGEKIVVFEKMFKYQYDLKSVKIYKASDNSNITKKLGYNSKKYTFTMPDYPIKVVIKLDKKNKVTRKANVLKAKLTSYNSVKLSGKYIVAKDEMYKYDYGFHSGFYIYSKIGNSKKYTYVGKTQDIGRLNKLSKITNIKNLKPGKKYTFKLIWYAVNYGDYGMFDALSSKSKTVTIRTLKKMNAPKVKKEDSKHVKVKVKEIKGATGYKIAVSKYKDKGFKTISTIKKGNNSKVIKAKKNKKLYYKVRAYKKEGKKNIYAPWSKVKAYKLK